MKVEIYEKPTKLEGDCRIAIMICDTYCAGGWSGYGYVAVVTLDDTDRVPHAISASCISCVQYYTGLVYMGKMERSQGERAYWEARALIEDMGAV